jgi:hypothetical protein
MNEDSQAGAAGDPAGAPDGAAPRKPIVDHTVCLCAGLGPLITEALRTLKVPEEVRRSVHETEREGLRLLRTLIEMRLSSLGPDGGTAPPKGTSVKVE